VSVTVGYPHAASSLFDFGPLADEYDRWYETPAGRAHDRVQIRDVRRLLRPARAGERLLDVGCGTGHWSRFFLSLRYDVHGIDISPEMIAVARTSVPGCDFDVADACALPFEDASFDVVAAMATLEFIRDPPAALREMSRCVKPGGSLLIGTLNGLAPLNQHRLSRGRQPYASAHLLVPEELRGLLRPYGAVRMLASSVSRREKRLPLARMLPRCVAPLRRCLSGPFIVAEVRT